MDCPGISRPGPGTRLAKVHSLGWSRVQRPVHSSVPRGLPKGLKGAERRPREPVRPSTADIASIARLSGGYPALACQSFPAPGHTAPGSTALAAEGHLDPHLARGGIGLHFHAARGSIDLTTASTPLAIRVRAGRPQSPTPPRPPAPRSPASLIGCSQPEPETPK